MVEVLDGELIFIKLVGLQHDEGHALQNLKEAEECEIDCDVMSRKEG